MLTQQAIQEGRKHSGDFTRLPALVPLGLWARVECLRARLSAAAYHANIRISFPLFCATDGPGSIVRVQQMQKAQKNLLLRGSVDLGVHPGSIPLTNTAEIKASFVLGRIFAWELGG